MGRMAEKVMKRKWVSDPREMVVAFGPSPNASAGNLVSFVSLPPTPAGAIIPGMYHHAQPGQRETLSGYGLYVLERRMDMGGRTRLVRL